MRAFTILGAAIGATLMFAPSANADRVCKQVCDGGTCVQKCVESEPTVELRDERIRREERRPGVELRVPGVDIGIGR